MFLQTSKKENKKKPLESGLINSVTSNYSQFGRKQHFYKNDNSISQLISDFSNKVLRLVLRNALVEEALVLDPNIVSLYEAVLTSADKNVTIPNDFSEAATATALLYNGILNYGAIKLRQPPLAYMKIVRDLNKAVAKHLDLALVSESLNGTAVAALKQELNKYCYRVLQRGLQMIEEGVPSMEDIHEEPKVIKWKMQKDKYAGAYQDISSKFVGEDNHIPLVKNAVGYFSQFPSTPGDLANNAAGRYAADGFDNPGPNEIAERYRVAIGVNLYRKVKSTAPEDRVRGAVTGQNRTDGPRTALIGFVWEPAWKKTVNDDEKPALIPSKNVKDDEDYHDSQLEQIRKEERDHATESSRIPYGRLRDHILRHAKTATLMAELRANNNNVYIHVSDADAKMVKTASNVDFEVDTDTEESARGLFSRYDKLIKEYLFKNESISYPDMVSGGYKFTLPASEEEGTVEESTIRAQQLDEKVRAALVRHLGALGVYLPEPNTLVKDQGEYNANLFTSDISDGGGTQEGASMVMEVFKKDPALKAIYDGRAHIATRTSARFKEMQRPLATTNKITRSDLKAIIGQNQSSAGRPNWVHNVSRWMYMQEYKRLNSAEDESVDSINSISWFHKIADKLHGAVVRTHDFARKSRTTKTDEEMQELWTDITTNNDREVNLNIGDTLPLSPTQKTFLKTGIGASAIRAAYETDKVINAELPDIYKGVKTVFKGNE